MTAAEQLRQALSYVRAHSLRATIVPTCHFIFPGSFIPFENHDGEWTPQSVCLVTTDFPLFVEKAGACSLLPGTRAPVWVLAPQAGAAPAAVDSATPTSHHLGTQPGHPGSSAFLRERVYHTLWLHLELQSSETNAATISRHGPQNSAHRQHLPNTQMAPHKPCQEDFYLPTSLTSWGTAGYSWPISSCHSGSFPSGHSLGPSASTLPLPRA